MDTVQHQIERIVTSTVYCHLDSLDEFLLSGWAVDRASPDSPALIHVIVDGQEVAAFRCDAKRPDVKAAGIASEAVGFKLRLPEALLDGKSHRLEMRDSRRQIVVLNVHQQSTASVDFTIVSKPEVVSFVDGLRQGAFEGWVLRKANSTAVYESNLVVRITCDGATIGHARANRHRGDVAQMLSAPPNCGFQFVPPSSVRRGYPRDFRFYLMPENTELMSSPQHTTVVSDAEEGRLLALVDSVDELHRELTRIRRQVRELLPQPGFTLATYDAWYRVYEETLRTRRFADAVQGSMPLVSVICPVYRPDLKDFEEAVKSVRAQTYPNWELILTDDCSKSPDLTAMINRFAAEDDRIHAVPRRKNGGISAATNTALSVARGDWVAFFDHDDLLATVALACMVAAAQGGNKTVLYSDEDKVDASGVFSDPAFKPDWNHRLLLGVNYVCHLLMVRRDILDKTGPLRTVYDGAQDHDLILRLSETVSEHEILHVPEVLYHWRKTANSTASSVTAKPYAVKAGEAAVRDHLQRTGRAARVSTIKGNTLYDVRFTPPGDLAVTIVIPFKDQIETTRRCIHALEAHNDYKSWNVILLDNWSTSIESKGFVEEVRRRSNMTVLSVEEPFNYSRLNNKAVELTKADYVIFMNNDLFVLNDDWLSAIIGEAESNVKVGAVGGRFTYPNGTVQHAGVVLGLGGVAGHVHVGIPFEDGGYGGRAMFAQEMSAVTAAGMLVRRSAFLEVGGFDEGDLPVAFNDIDLCLKLRRSGYKVIYTPAFRAEHHESLSRGDDERPLQEARFFQEVEVMKQRWGAQLQRDPFYSPHFALNRKPFFDLEEPRR